MSMLGAPAAISLHRVGGADLDDVMAIMRIAFDPQFGEAWTRAQCAGILPMSGVRMILARSNDLPLGFALTRHVADEAELLLLAVSPHVQGQGVGSTLLRDFIAYGTDAGLSRLHLEVRASNPAASLYSRHQFVLEGRRPKYYRGTNGQFHDALTMGRSIVPGTA
jgi:ribosomal-protein-alanine N-acetyltransferase